MARFKRRMKELPARRPALPKRRVGDRKREWQRPGVPAGRKRQHPVGRAGSVAQASLPEKSMAGRDARPTKKYTGTEAGATEETGRSPEDRHSQAEPGNEMG